MTTDLEQMRDPLGLLRLGYAEPLLPHHAIRWVNGVESDSAEEVAEEVPLALIYNGIPHVVMMGTPSDLEDFALGFSITEELIGGPGDISGIEVVRYSRGIEIQVAVAAACETEINSRSRRLSGRTGCGICGADSIASVLKQLHPVGAGPRIDPRAIHRAMDGLVSRQVLNARAGAIHAAGWATLDGTIQMAREDVGRHNALDKLIGALLKGGTSVRDGFLVVTSRASFEMVQKATVLGAPLLAAISGPTGLAVRVAHQAGMTLVGFTRGGKHTVYAHGDRVTETTAG